MFSKDRIVLAVSIVGVAVIIASLASAQLSIPAVVLAALIALGLGAALWFLLDRTRKRREIELGDVPSEPVRVSSLGAEVDSRKILSDSERFATVTAKRPLETQLPLAPRIRKFLEDFESVRTVFGDYEIGRQHLAPSLIEKGYLRIGVGPAEIEISTPTSDERVFELEQGEPDEDPAKDIFHYVLEINRRIHG